MSRSSSIGSSSSRRPRFGDRPDPFPLLRLLQRDLSRVQDDYHELKKENIDLTIALQESKTLVDDLRIELQETQVNLGTVKHDLGVTRVEMSNLRRRLENAEDSLEKLEEDILTDDEEGGTVVRRRRVSPSPSPLPPSPVGDFSHDMDAEGAEPSDDEYAPPSPH